MLMLLRELRKEFATFAARATSSRMALSAKVQAPSVASCISRNVVSAFQPAGARPQQRGAVVARVAEVCVGHAGPGLIDAAVCLENKDEGFNFEQEL